MLENPSKRRLEEQAAADLIDRNVSFDFKSFLTKIGPAPSFSEPAGPTPQCLSVDLIRAFHNGELNTSRQMAVKEHVASCETCSELLASYTQSQPAEMPEHLFQRISNRLRLAAASGKREDGQRHSWLAAPQVARWLAAPAMALVLAWILYPARPYLQKSPGQEELAASNRELSMEQDISQLKDRLAQNEKANAELEGDLKVVTDKLKITQQQLQKARLETAKQNTETTQKLTALDTSVHSELATKATTDDVRSVDTRVVGVKTDLDATREDLKMARSEMGTLIARNHDEIDQLRRLGERDYVEFTVAGENQPQRVGNITVELKGVNEKQNRFSVVMTVEDKRFEKKHAVNEPIFFYLSGTRRPEELVVNKVGKNTISGYISIPKT
jgi:hypothetical protein